MKQIKKQFIMLIVFISIGFISNAQNYNAAVSLSSGYVQDGFGLQGSYNFTLNKKEYIQSSLLVTFSKEKYLYMEIPTNIASLNIGYYNTIFRNLRQTLSWSLGGGMIGGYEFINNGNSDLANGAEIGSESKLIYGFFIGSEHDIYINNYYSILIKVQEFYHLNSDAGKLLPYAGIGVRYYIF